jgi:hypothetical protein
MTRKKHLPAQRHHHKNDQKKLAPEYDKRQAKEITKFVVKRKSPRYVVN